MNNIHINDLYALCGKNFIQIKEWLKNPQNATGFFYMSKNNPRRITQIALWAIKGTGIPQPPFPLEDYTLSDYPVELCYSKNGNMLKKVQRKPRILQWLFR